MYMGPITAADVQPDGRESNLAKAAGTPAHPILRMAVGVPVLLLAALVMLPWAAVIAVSAGVFLGVRSVLAAPRAVAQAADYAGRIALGR
jgi:hypothetical protein